MGLCTLNKRSRTRSRLGLLVPEINRSTSLRWYTILLFLFVRRYIPIEIADADESRKYDPRNKNSTKGMTIPSRGKRNRVREIF
jgi:hypothetical protein